MIERLALPEMPGSAEGLVDPSGREFEPGRGHSAQRPATPALQKCVDVVWHDDKGIKIIAVPVKLLDTLRDHGRQIRIAQHAFAVPLVEPLVPAAIADSPKRGTQRGGKSGGQLDNVLQFFRRHRDSVPRQPVDLLAVPEIDHGLRHRIESAKRHKDGDSRLKPMRQITNADLQLRVRIKRLKDRLLRHGFLQSGPPGPGGSSSINSLSRRGPAGHSQCAPPGPGGSSYSTNSLSRRGPAGHSEAGHSGATDCRASLRSRPPAANRASSTQS